MNTDEAFQVISKAYNIPHKSIMGQIESSESKNLELFLEILHAANFF